MDTQVTARLTLSRRERIALCVTEGRLHTLMACEPGSRRFTLRMLCSPVPEGVIAHISDRSPRRWTGEPFYHIQIRTDNRPAPQGIWPVRVHFSGSSLASNAPASLGAVLDLLAMARHTCQWPLR